MEEKIKRYKFLCEEVKHQVKFLSDVYAMDFNYFRDVLKEMEQLQASIRSEQAKINFKRHGDSPSF